MGDGLAEAIALANLLQAPVATSYLHNDAFPAAHPLACGPLGYQGSKAAMQLHREGRRRAGARHAARAVRHAAAIRDRLLAAEGEDHPGRCRRENAGPREADRRRHLRRRGRCRRGADAASRFAHAGVRREQGRAHRRDRGGEEGMGGRARRLDSRDRRVVARCREGVRRDASARSCCASSRARCRPARWCRPTSATSARWRTRTSRSTARARCSRR